MVWNTLLGVMFGMIIKDWTINERNILNWKLKDGRDVTLTVTDRWLVNRSRPFIRTITGAVHELVLDGKMTKRGKHFIG